MPRVDSNRKTNHNINMSNDNMHHDCVNDTTFQTKTEAESLFPFYADKSLDYTDGLIMRFKESIKKFNPYEVQNDSTNFNSSNRVIDSNMSNKTVNHKHHVSSASNPNIIFNGQCLNTEKDSSLYSTFASSHHLNGDCSTIDFDSDISETIVSSSETNYSAHFNFRNNDFKPEIQQNKISVHKNQSLPPAKSLVNPQNFCSNFEFSDKTINKSSKTYFGHETFKPRFDRIEYISTHNVSFGNTNMSSSTRQVSDDSGRMVSSGEFKVCEASRMRHQSTETYSINIGTSCQQHLSINVIFDGQHWIPLGSSFTSTDRNCTLSNGSFCEPFQTPKRYSRPGNPKRLRRHSSNFLGNNPNNDQLNDSSKRKISRSSSLDRKVDPSESTSKVNLPYPFPCLFLNRLSDCAADSENQNKIFMGDEISNKKSPFLMIVKEDEYLPLKATLRNYENDKNAPPFKASILSNASTENISVKHNDKLLRPTTSNEANTKRNTRQSVELMSRLPNRQNEPSTSRMPSRASEEIATKKQARQSMETQSKRQGHPSQEQTSRSPHRSSNEVRSKSAANSMLRVYESEENAQPFKAEIFSNTSTENISVKHNDKLLMPTTSNEANTKRNTRQSVEPMSRLPNRQNEPSTSRMPSRASEEITTKKQPSQSMETQTKARSRPSQEQTQRSPHRSSNEVRSKSAANATLRTYENEKNAPPFKAEIFSNTSTENISVKHNNQLLKPTTSNELPSKKPHRRSNEIQSRRDTRSRDDVQSKKNNPTIETSSKSVARAFENERKTPLFRNASTDNLSVNPTETASTKKISRSTEATQSKKDNIVPKKKSREPKRSESAASVSVTVDTGYEKKPEGKAANEASSKKRNVTPEKMFPRKTSLDTEQRRTSTERAINVKIESVESESGTSVSIGLKVETGEKQKASRNDKPNSASDSKNAKHQRDEKQKNQKNFYPDEVRPGKTNRETEQRRTSTEKGVRVRMDSVESESATSVSIGLKVETGGTQRVSRNEKPSSSSDPKKTKRRHEEKPSKKRITAQNEMVPRRKSRESNERKPSTERALQFRMESVRSESETSVSIGLNVDTGGKQKSIDNKKGKRKRDEKARIEKNITPDQITRKTSRETDQRRPSTERGMHVRMESVESESGTSLSVALQLGTGGKQRVADEIPSKKPNVRDEDVANIKGNELDQIKRCQSAEPMSITVETDENQNITVKVVHIATDSKKRALFAPDEMDPRNVKHEEHERQPSTEMNIRMESVDSESGTSVSIGLKIETGGKQKAIDNERLNMVSNESKKAKRPSVDKPKAGRNVSQEKIVPRKHSREAEQGFNIRMESVESESGTSVSLDVNMGPGDKPKKSKKKKQTPVNVPPKRKGHASGELVPRKNSREQNQRNPVNESALQLRMESVESESATSVSVGIKMERGAKQNNVGVDIANISNDAKKMKNSRNKSKEIAKNEKRSIDQDKKMLRSASNESMSLQIDYNTTGDQDNDMRSNQVSINVARKIGNKGIGKEETTILKVFEILLKSVTKALIDDGIIELTNQSQRKHSQDRGLHVRVESIDSESGTSVSIGVRMETDGRERSDGVDNKKAQSRSKGDKRLNETKQSQKDKLVPRKNSREEDPRRPSKERGIAMRVESVESESGTSVSIGLDIGGGGKQKPVDNVKNKDQTDTKMNARNRIEKPAQRNNVSPEKIVPKKASREANVKKPSKERGLQLRMESVESESGTSVSIGLDIGGGGKKKPVNNVKNKNQSDPKKDKRNIAEKPLQKTPEKKTPDKIVPRKQSRDVDTRKPSKERGMQMRVESVDNESITSVSIGVKMDGGRKQKSVDSGKNKGKSDFKDNRRYTGEQPVKKRNVTPERLLPTKPSRDADKRKPSKEKGMGKRNQSVGSETSVSINVDTGNKQKPAAKGGQKSMNFAKEAKKTKQTPTTKGSKPKEIAGKGSKAKGRDKMGMRSVSSESISLQIDYKSTGDQDQQSRSHQISISIEMKKGEEESEKEEKGPTVSRASNFFPEKFNDRPNVCVIPVVNCQPYICERKSPDLCAPAFRPYDFKCPCDLTPRRFTQSDANIPCSVSNILSVNDILKDKVIGDCLHKTSNVIPYQPVCELRRSVSSTNYRCRSSPRRAESAQYVRQNDVWPPLARNFDNGIPLPYGYCKPDPCGRRIHPVIPCLPDYNHKPFIATHDRILTPRNDCLNCSSCHKAINFKNRNEHIATCLKASYTTNSNNNNGKGRNQRLKAILIKRDGKLGCSVCKRSNVKMSY